MDYKEIEKKFSEIDRRLDLVEKQIGEVEKLASLAADPKYQYQETNKEAKKCDWKAFNY